MDPVYNQDADQPAPNTDPVDYTGTTDRGMLCALAESMQFGGASILNSKPHLDGYRRTNHRWNQRSSQPLQRSGREYNPNINYAYNLPSNKTLALCCPGYSSGCDSSLYHHRGNYHGTVRPQQHCQIAPTPAKACSRVHIHHFSISRGA